MEPGLFNHMSSAFFSPKSAWQTSSYPEISDPEWVTEGVQVGSIGSGVGIIGSCAHSSYHKQFDQSSVAAGMWTGADQ